ncbi:MAG: NADH-ubiquinone oxidoreductase chain E [uncultured Solirubrobacteraceae bacterium]|uniref:NADH-ubiquinone oxidoreductase chain E n=1 Tax=uncultured Solirubrobacteraceae bacterium TaxID=1162706 RepID=A0A6J4RUZ8_9ACTN|nr:MAG: NADH-ubiquinone oxidoreductase chain E [uncultured Solirubrobacteraceae bacterium]
MIGRRKKGERAGITETTAATAADPIGARAAEMPGREVTRFGHGSRVPGWDDAVDLDKDPAQIPDPATTPVPAALREEIEAHMAKYPDFRSAAIPALAAAQRVHGWCSPEAIWQAACVMRLTPGYLIGVASFYDMLETQPVGRHSVYVCTNISCSLCGADELLARLEEETEGDPDFNVRHFECLGACDIAPMASVDGIYVGPITLDEVAILVEQIREGTPPLPGKQLRKRKSTDPGAARPVAGDADPGAAPAIEGGADPITPTTTYGTPMGGEITGPPAAIEEAPPPPEEDDDT